MRMRRIVSFLLLLLLIGSLLGCGSDSVSGNQPKTLEDINDSTVGILTGSIYDPVVGERYPDAERKYYSQFSDMIVSMEQGKIDCFMADHSSFIAMLWEGQNLAVLEEPLYEVATAMIFPKGSAGTPLMETMDAFIEACWDDGTMEYLETKWLGPQEPDEHPDYSGLTGENGTLKVAVGTSLKPMSYQKGGVFTGYEVELLTMFAEAHGYALELEGLVFESIISGVVSGKYDLGVSSLSITEERKQSVDFTEPHLYTGGVAVISGDPAQSTQSVFHQIRDSFEKTFLRENRWLLILKGVGITALISVCSVLGGSVIGSSLYLLSQSQRPAVRRITRLLAKIYARIVAGTPVIVILMILFYVVFAAFRDISGILVAVIGFSLTFGAFVYGNLNTCVDSVPAGQSDAVSALGYTRWKGFFRVILPQTMTIFLPTYCGEIISLIKATAVVGYIAVNDLTKIGDIIRSNTYEAFFPLISTAVIYFLLTWLAAALLQRLKYHYDPKRRSPDQILKHIIVK